MSPSNFAQTGLQDSSSHSYDTEQTEPLTKSQEDRIFAQYMRYSSSPDSDPEHDDERSLSVEELEDCDDNDAVEECDDEEYEDDDDGLISQVPLSSSPPDFTSSSPQSCSLGSRDSETCSTLTPLSSDCGSQENPITRRQVNVSEVDLSGSSGMKDFTRKLHTRLLAVLEECRRSKTLSPSNHDNNLSATMSRDRSNSFVAATSDEANSQTEGLYAARNECATPSIYGDGSSSPAEAQTFRIIKRARSKVSYDSAEDDGEGPSKRQKTAQDAGPHAKTRIYAHRTASLRRAESLKIVYIDAAKKADNYVETVPATPVPPSLRRVPSSQRGPQVGEDRQVFASPVPVIAPPAGHLSKFPLSPEQLAKQRLFALLDREQNMREQDGLYDRICRGPHRYSVPNEVSREPCRDSTLASEWEHALGLGRQDREEAIEWILEVMPKCPSRASSVNTSTSASSKSTSTGATQRYSGSDSAISLGTPSCRSTSSVSTPVARESSPSSSLSNMEDQLLHSPNTRFHAAWMLLRYFRLCMNKGDDDSKSLAKSTLSRTSSSVSAVSNGTEKEGLNLVLWDAAVACLSISIKFQRDFLDPLLPVFANEYLTLAPHEMGHDDLETAHRDILSAFDYRLGVTPEAVMNELWLALPSLRTVLSFEGGWDHATSHTWSALFIALDGDDVVILRACCVCADVSYCSAVALKALRTRVNTC